MFLFVSLFYELQYILLTLSLSSVSTLLLLSLLRLVSRRSSVYDK